MEKIAKNPRGRPSHTPTKATREQVQLRVAMRWSELDIARDLGIDGKTLRKHYREDIRIGKRKKQGQAVDLLWASARSGNVSAQKSIIVLFSEQPGEAGKAAKAKTEVLESFEESPVPPRSMALGKKVQRQLEAESAGIGTGWGEDLIPGDGKPN